MSDTGMFPPLPVPRTAGGRAGLAALIAQPTRALVGLDFDGTLSPIVPDPAAARADPRAAAAMHLLAGLVGTVAIITGRPAARAAELAGLDSAPSIIVLGQYGIQRWEAGQLSSPPPPPGLAAARIALPGLLAQVGADPGTAIEEKGGYAVAVHTRRAARPEAELEALRAPLAELAEQNGLSVEPGRLVIELRPPGSDKGRALRELAAERDSAAVMFCGDDLGDRAAFLAVRELRAAGTPGLAVCSASAEVPELAAEADLVVPGPPGVADLLGGLAAAIAAARAEGPA